MDIPGLTPEQQAAVEKALADARKQGHDAYDAEAHKFREWIKANPLPGARVCGGIGLILGIPLTYLIQWVMHFFKG